MTFLLALSLLLAVCTTGTSGECTTAEAEMQFNEQGKPVKLVCTTGGGEVKYPGETWSDPQSCMECRCDAACCGYGYAMPEEMYPMLDGERCKMVRTGDACNDYKFVKASDSSVQCPESPSP